MHVSAKNIYKYFEQSTIDYPTNIALICDNISLTYLELNKKVNQFSNFLLEQGISANQHVCVLLERSLESYVAMLAIFKIGAVYVPLDVKYPMDRIKYILNDLNVKTIITKKNIFPNINIEQRIELSSIDILLKTYSNELDTSLIEYSDCYIIYTSGTTGKPKGINISHRNIMHYIKSASQVYLIESTDKIYQGFSLSFDASMEEVWMAFAHGATLIACTSDDIRAGVGLIEFLNQHQITVLSTVPSLLASLESNIPSLRLIILGGESCYAQHIENWFSSNRRIINSYGPTEASVVSTFAELNPNDNITIGKPLPGYEVLILNQELAIAQNGEEGELCIGGPAISKGYINLHELTQTKFIKHPQKKNEIIYRTGDLGKINEDEKIIFLGRIDDQIKLRGFRIELNEIESVMSQYPGIIRAAAKVTEGNNPILVAYYETNKNNAIEPHLIQAFLKEKLPEFMIPAHLEQLSKFPLLASGKIDRKNLPKPNFQQTETDTFIKPQNDTEKLIVQIFKEVFKKTISTHSHFFYDLGGHSLFAAQVISKLRKHNGFEHLSIKDLYQYPTVQLLAQTFKPKTNHQSSNSSKTRYQPSHLSYVLTSIGQFFGALINISVHSWPVLFIWLYFFINNQLSQLEYILYSFIIFVSYPIFSALVMISLKWLILGKVKSGKYPIYGWFYFRWWLFSRIENNFMYFQYFSGTPLINIYYRLMGAKIAKNTFIANIHLKSSYTCYDLLQIGENTSIGLDARLDNLYIKDNYLNVGPIQIGHNCYVGNRALVSPDTVMENNSYLDDMAFLKEHERIPSGQFYSGTPAKLNPKADEFQLRKKIQSTSKNKYSFLAIAFNYSFVLLTSLINSFGYLISFFGLLYLYQAHHSFTETLLYSPIIALLSILSTYGLIKIANGSFYKPLHSGSFSIYSVSYYKYWFQALTLANPMIGILADTIFAPYIYRFFGMKIGKNCELGDFHYVPIHLVEFEDTVFQASTPSLAWPIFYQNQMILNTLKLEKSSFIGNWAYIKQKETIGEHVLIGVRSTLPLNHQAKNKNSGWLGNPSIFLPTRQIFSDIPETFTLKPTLKLKLTRAAIETIRIILPTNLVSLSFLFIYLISINIYYSISIIHSILVIPTFELFTFVGISLGVIVFKWLLIGKLKPTIKPLWSLYIWKYDIIEYLFSDFINNFYLTFFLGSIFSNYFLRLMGCKIGKKTNIYSFLISEFDLTHIGDDTTVNENTLLQCHLYEDRIYKNSHINIDDHCDIGTNSTILYDTHMENYSSLGSQSLLMKGETLPQNTNWEGSPAQFCQEKIEELTEC